MSDDNKTDPMAKARAAKAAKAAAKPAEPEMGIVERKVTETTHKTTPTGQEKTKTVETIFRPKATTPEAETTTAAAATSAEPQFTEAEQAAIDRAGQTRPSVFKTLMFYLLLFAMLAIVAFAAISSRQGETEQTPPAPAVEAAPEVVEPAPAPTPEAAPEPEPEVATPTPAPPPAVRAPAPKPRPATPAPAPMPAPVAETPALESASPPPPSPERNMTAYIMRPFGDRRDDFIVYDFDFRRVCVTNSSDRAELPQTGCMAYESLSTSWKTTYDQLCRRYYAFAEVCPADVTVDVVLRELRYHENDSKTN